jgi:hypothetical protein
MNKIEVRRMNAATWVRLEDGLAVIPVRLAEGEKWFDEWRELLGDAIREGSYRLWMERGGGMNWFVSL